jgi:hypothetical protein
MCLNERSLTKRKKKTLNINPENERKTTGIEVIEKG